MVWMLPGAAASAVVVVATTYLIAAARLPHVIAGSTDALYAVLVGAATWGDYLWHFLVPVLLGNVLGGSTLVGALGHAQVATDVHVARQGRGETCQVTGSKVDGERARMTRGDPLR
jgi:formate/nitrite transporter FocA (FNT family)